MEEIRTDDPPANRARSTGEPAAEYATLHKGGAFLLDVSDPVLPVFASAVIGTEQSGPDGSAKWAIQPHEAMALMLSSSLETPLTGTSTDLTSEEARTAFRIMLCEPSAHQFFGFLANLRELVSMHEVQGIEGSTSLAMIERLTFWLRQQLAEVEPFPLFGWRRFRLVSPQADGAAREGAPPRVAPPPTARGRASRSRTAAAAAATAEPSDDGLGDADPAVATPTPTVPGEISILSKVGIENVSGPTEQTAGASGMLQIAKLVLAIGPVKHPETLYNPRGPCQQIIRSLWPWFLRHTNQGVSLLHDQEALASMVGPFLGDCALEYKLSAIGTESGGTPSKLAAQDLVRGAVMRYGTADEIRKTETDCLLSYIRKFDSFLPTIRLLFDGKPWPAHQVLRICERLTAALVTSRGELSTRHVLPDLESKLHPSHHLIASSY